jgi:hypothetical protein
MGKREYLSIIKRGPEQHYSLVTASFLSARRSSRMWPVVPRAWLSTDTDKQSKKTNTTKQDNNDDDETNELVLTPGEKVVVAGRLTMWAGIAIFASICAYYIIKELMPT